MLALLPSYAGLSDPVLDLRLACLDAVSWLGSDVVVVGDPQGCRVGHSLLSAAGVSRRDFVPPQPPEGGSYLVVGNGSARRSEKAPGHLDERSFAFDDGLRAALASSDAGWSDFALGDDLLASLDGIRELLGLLPAGTPAQVDYDDDPFGVRYWVMRWEWS
ncbi:hypothetical protein [Nocardioides lianchengensis]|uniref:hypothetical protein n=1 Tax=Nocardioides lianchengensis TaxID=1045774 RepID=UPI00181EA357|nr:hypothetical protein [Nocardioides lianchengensis]NYG13312.1 hypothetical protein [Nocardioides lianchengensis]